MDAKDELKNIADFVVDLLTDERGSKNDTEQPQSVDPNAELFQTDPALADALDHAAAADLDDDGPLGTGRGLRSIMADDDDPVSQVARVAKVAPVVKAAPAPQPVREVVHNVVRERVIHDRPQVTRVTEQHAHNTFLREGDNIVDNRTVNNINAEGEDISINLDQTIDNKTVIADDGGIAAGGNVEDSALNTGRVQGVLAGDDVDAEDAIVGDDNTAIDDSEVGAFAGKGDATNVDNDNDDRGAPKPTDDDDKPTDGDGPRADDTCPVDEKAPDGDHDVLREDVELDRKEEPVPDDEKTADQHNADATETGAKETTDNGDPSQRPSGDTTVEDQPKTDVRAEDSDRTEEQAKAGETDDGQPATDGSNGSDADQQAKAGETDDGQPATDGSNGSNGSDADQQAKAGETDDGQRAAEDGKGSDVDQPAKAFDADGDGLVDHPEQFDTNSDGVLDNPEQFDTDGDGLIDRPDLLDFDHDGDADFLLRPADSFSGDDDLDLDN